MFRQPHRIILILILILLLIKAYFSEKILINEGLGWDGQFYGDFTKNIDIYLKNHSIDKYHFQRIGIPFILHYTLSFFNISLTSQNVINAFSFLNIFFIILACVYFFLIANQLQLKRNIEIIGFASMFLCFPVLKFSLYYPVLMDTAAFTIGSVFVYYYIRQKTSICFLLIFIGSFIYPTFIIMCILLIFKKNNILLPNTHENSESPSWTKLKFLSVKLHISYLLFRFSLPVMLIFIMIYIYYEGSFEAILKDFNYDPLKMTVFWFSFFLALLYVIYLTNFPKSIFSFLKILKSINPIGIFISIGVYILLQSIINKYASTENSFLTFSSYLYNIVNQASKNPFNFIVAHVFYFGLSPILSLFIFQDFKNVVLQYGYGMLAFFVAIVFFSVGNESRQLINYYPFLVLLMLHTLNKYWNVSFTFSAIYAILCLAISHFWFSINTNLTSETDYSKLEYFYTFPIQQYFMFQGPWVSDYMYKIHLIVVIIILLFVWLLFKKFNLLKRNSEDVLIIN